MENFELNEELFSVRFDLIDGKIKESDINSVFGLLNGTPVDVEFTASAAGLISYNAADVVSLYPNPTTGQLNILSKDSANVQLMDVTGQLVLVQTTVNANEKLTLDMTGLASGTYLVKIYNNYFSTTERVVVTK